MKIGRDESDVRDVLHPQFAAGELEGGIVLQTEANRNIIYVHLQVQLHCDRL